uniref:Uncharacterized protein n=1 Tax=Oryza sativa subsp. japonica TaxID=39947 RepID=Q6ZC40_ORYSJ|nr:hypothetical protein [Oryza sativa Japonica Group]
MATAAAPSPLLGPAGYKAMATPSPPPDPAGGEAADPAGGEAAGYKATAAPSPPPDPAGGKVAGYKATTGGEKEAHPSSPYGDDDRVGEGRWLPSCS